MFRIPLIALIILLSIGLLVIGFIYTNNQAATPTVSPLASPLSTPTVATVTPSPNAIIPIPATTRIINAADIPNHHSAYTFQAEIPSSWQVEAVSGSQAINFYDPASPGATNLEKSQIFMRYFSANNFLTLSTVTIHTQTAQTIAGRPAVRYDIEKKASAASFPNQPAWRNVRHIVTDIRTTDTNPTVFYVVARRPDVPEATYQSFLQSLKSSSATNTSSFIEPIAEFTARITKKPFGILINPATSPVQPERFAGYHTGADIEYTDTTADVPIKAITNGTVVHSGRASGYGGVVVLQHNQGSQSFTSLYGHLKVASLPQVGASIKAGQQIGILGEAESSDTDGERKHLHFAIHKGTQTDLRGYVSNQTELSAWENPVSFLAS